MKITTVGIDLAKNVLQIHVHVRPAVSVSHAPLTFVTIFALPALVFVWLDWRETRAVAARFLMLSRTANLAIGCE